ncbi:MAG: alpha/beta hydrolase family protein [Pseudomonadota bacterium]
MHMRVLRRAFCALLLTLGTDATAAAPSSSASPFLDAIPCFGLDYDPWIARLSGKTDADPERVAMLQAKFPRSLYENAQQRLDCHAIRYESDGLVILGWMVAPKHAPDAKLPVVIFNRGGNGGFGALKFADLFTHVFPLADQGFLVLASQYRGVSDADPARFGVDEFGGADVNDVRRLIDLARQIPGADADNVFLLGFSRGAMQGYLAARNRDDIRAMAMVNGVVDLEADLAFRPEMETVYRARIPGYADDKTQRLRERSALAWAEELPKAAPILLMHGTEDERVAPGNGPKMQQRLDALQHPNRLILFEGEDHFLDPTKAIAEAVAWFRAYLR